MFSFFKKKPVAAVTDLVYTTQDAKWKALLKAGNANPSPVFIAWFEDSLQALQGYFNQHQLEASIIEYRHVHTGAIRNANVIFIEHHPLSAKEQKLFTSLQDREIVVYSSLDEPFFTWLGGERISGMLKSLGMQDDEPISHPMITRSIRQAQEKIAKRVTLEEPASGSKEWVSRNLGSRTA